MSEDKDLNVLVTVKDLDETINVGDDLKIDKGNLDEEFMQQPSKYAWWATLSALAKDATLNAELALSVYTAELFEKIKKEMTDGGEKTTNMAIENKCFLDKEWRKRKEECLKRKKRQDILAGVATAFAQRKDMLLSLGPMVRQEMDSDLKIKVLKKEVERSKEKSKQKEGEGNGQN